MTEVDVGRGRVEAELDAQRPPLREPLREGAARGRHSTALRARKAAVPRRVRFASIRPNANVSPPARPEYRAASRPARRPLRRTFREGSGLPPGKGGLVAEPMSESERDTHPAGDTATRTPPEGTRAVEPDANDNVIPLGRGSLLRPEPGSRRVRIRKLRVFGVLLGLILLAIVSTLFGMMMAVTSDLPSLEEPAGRNSVLTDRNGVQLGMLTGNQKRIFLQSNEIAPVMKQAIIAIEDRRFYTNAGIDLRGIGRALYQDIRAQKAVQGGSTITMQFVKLVDSPRRTSARCSRSSARPRSPTRSRASGPRSGSCATTSTRSTSATARTGSSPPRAPTSASTIPAAGPPRPRPSAPRCSSRARPR